MNSTHSSPFLSLQNVLFIAPGSQTAILKDISFQAKKSEIIMLIGSNGSGKSSLLKVINGLYLPSKGAINLLGDALIHMSVRARSHLIATMNQDANLVTFSELTVYENYLMAKEKKRLRANNKKEAADYLQSFNPNLALKLEQQVEKLSGGERQALGLALHLMHKPELILLDEHTSALDPKSAKKLMEITIQAIKESKACAIICTHNLQDALDYGTRLIMMQSGTITLDVREEEKRRLTKEDLLQVYTRDT